MKRGMNALPGITSSMNVAVGMRRTPTIATMRQRMAMVSRGESGGEAQAWSKLNQACLSSDVRVAATGVSRSGKAPRIGLHFVRSIDGAGHLRLAGHLSPQGVGHDVENQVLFDRALKKVRLWADGSQGDVLTRVRR